jgi:hypothetical protein
MVDYIRAIKRPFTNFKKLIIGLLFSLPIPLVSIFTNVVATGYSFEAGRSAWEKDYELPEWKKMGKLWVNAFLASIIGLIYMIPVFILAFALAKDFMMNYITNSSEVLASFLQNPIKLLLGSGTGLIITIIIGAIIGYLVPVAILKFIKEGSFKSAFDFKDIFSKVLTGKYLLATVVIWIAGIAILFVTRNLFPVATLADPMSLFTGKNLVMYLVPVITSSIIGFIMSIFSFTVYGNVLEELK